LRFSAYVPQNLFSLCGSSVSCACGLTHTVYTQSVIFGRGKIDALEAAVGGITPPLSNLTVISDRTVREVTGRAFEKKLLKLGYRVSPHTFSVPLFPSAAAAYSVSVPEDCRLIVGYGGGAAADVTKFVAARTELPAVFILTSPASLGVLSPSAMLYCGGLEQTFKIPAFKSVICDTDYLPRDFTGPLIASAFGELISKAVSLFDYKCAGLLNAERFCAHAYGTAVKIIDDAIEKIPGMPDEDASAYLAESGLKFSLLAQALGNSRFFSGGESQLAHAIRLLFMFENRPLLLRGETEFLCGRIIAGVYKNFLSFGREFFVPPPDNNERLARIIEFLGVDRLSAMQKLRPVPPADKLKSQGYRYRESRLELLADIETVINRLSLGARIFKRLYPDLGYSLLNYFEPPDISLSAALAPDLKEKFSFLTYLKNIGILDGYL
jgi:glycerol dehydrogenase-like iron-containing ADH family enzyme